jgi:hypothetical protein
VLLLVGLDDPAPVPEGCTETVPEAEGYGAATAEVEVPFVTGYWAETAVAAMAARRIENCILVVWVWMGGLVGGVWWWLIVV